MTESQRKNIVGVPTQYLTSVRVSDASNEVVELPAPGLPFIYVDDVMANIEAVMRKCGKSAQPRVVRARVNKQICVIKLATASVRSDGSMVSELRVAVRLRQHGPGVDNIAVLPTFVVVSRGDSPASEQPPVLCGLVYPYFGRSLYRLILRWNRNGSTDTTPISKPSYAAAAAAGAAAAAAAAPAPAAPAPAAAAPAPAPAPAPAAASSPPVGIAFKLVLRVAIAVATCLTHLHKLGYVHGDMKPNNILIEGADDFDAPCVAKICDLETVTPVLEKQKVRSILVTALYASPEAVFEKLIGREDDVYAVGVMLMTMLVRNDDAVFPTAEYADMQARNMPPHRMWAHMARRGMRSMMPSWLRLLAYNSMLFRILEQYIALAYGCTHHMSRQRPSMYNVLGILLNLQRMASSADLDFIVPPTTAYIDSRPLISVRRAKTDATAAAINTRTVELPLLVDKTITVQMLRLSDVHYSSTTFKLVDYFSTLTDVPVQHGRKKSAATKRLHGEADDATAAAAAAAEAAHFPAWAKRTHTAATPKT